jgi:FkbM family methyltransferase
MRHPANAGLGVVTLAMARFVGDAGIIHSFEPNPAMQDLVSQSIDRSYQNVRLHKVALGSENSELDLYVPLGNIGAGSFVNRSGKTIKCPVRRLSDLIEAEKISSVRLAKIDVEGFENEVLLGSGSLLSDMRPVIILEANASVAIPFCEYPAISTLLKYSYRFLAIPKALLSMRVVEIDVERTGSPSHDIVAVPQEQCCHFIVGKHATQRGHNHPGFFMPGGENGPNAAGELPPSISDKRRGGDLT